MILTHAQIEVLTRSPLWAIRPGYSVFAALQTAKASEWEAAKPTTSGPKGNKIAVIPIQGVLTKDGPSWYGSSYNNITKAVQQAAADPEVKQIVLPVNSPGGHVTGLPECAAVIAQAAQVKPVHAMVEGQSASAAYWLTSQASNVVLTPSGEVGSVGVRLMHADISQMLENEGIRVTELYSGDFKTEWSPFQPLSDDAKAAMQPRLEENHNQFLSDIESGRGNKASDDAKTQRFGEGRMFSANDALRLGLVDKVQSANDFYSSITPAAEPETPNFGFAEERKKKIVAIEREKFTKALPE